MTYNALRALPLMLAVAAPAGATDQTPEEVLHALIDGNDSAYLTQSEQNLMMMQDEPAYWAMEQGEILFKEPRGPKQVSLEQCDFGKGPGVLEGAYVEMPRYFADAGKVMDLESRLMYCMKTLQGFTDEDKELKEKHGNTDLVKLQTYIAAQSNGMAWNPPLDHPLEKAMRSAGEEFFYRRAGISDFSCATCHGATGKRIRASVLPNASLPAEWTKAISWPAFRVGHDAVRGSQHRVSECIWQMRQAEIVYGSDAAIAIISFWTDKARGQPAIIPDVKR